MPRKSLIRALCALALVLFVSSALGSPVSAMVRNGDNRLVTPTAYDWPMLMHDSSHSASVVEPGPYTNAVLGHSSLSGGITGSPVAANESIYVIAGSSLKALNSSTLKPFWSKSIGGVTHSSPASAGGEVYVNEADGTIVAVNGATNGNGATDWRIQPKSSSPIVSSPTVQDGVLFVSFFNGSLVAISTSTQKVLWSYNTGSNLVASPAANGQLVAVGATNGVEYFIDEGTGSLYWSVQTGAGISSSASFSGANAYFGSNDSLVYAVDTASKAVSWEFATTGHVLSTPVAADGNVYAASLGGSLYAIKASTGSDVWTFSSGAVSADLALAEGTHKGLNPTYVPLVYVVSTSGTLNAVNRDTGKSVWNLALSGGNGGSPIVAYTKVYVGTSSGYFAEIGALRFATAAATFDTSGNYQTSFSPTSTVVIGANAAWGKFGLNYTWVSVTAPGKSKPVLVDNQTMTFTPGQSNYNLYYSLNLQNAKSGTYKIIVWIEDGNPKGGSANPRCCGWVKFQAQFTVS